MGGSQVSRYPDDRGGPLLEKEDEEVLLLLLPRFVVGLAFDFDFEVIIDRHRPRWLESGNLYIKSVQLQSFIIFRT